LFDRHGAINNIGYYGQIWSDYIKNGHFPRSGGFDQQELVVMIKLDMISRIIYTYKDFINNNKSDWSKMSKTQMEIARWIEKQETGHG